MSARDRFEEVVDRYYQALYRFGFSLAKEENRAADLVQQTYVIWAEKGDQLEDQTKAKTWLFTTLYREFLKQARRAKKYPETDWEAVEYELPGREVEVGRRMDGKRAVELLGGLDEIFRAPLTLFYLQEHTYLEIAEILGIPIGTVMSRISRGKGILRKQMEGSEKVVPFSKNQEGQHHG